MFADEAAKKYLDALSIKSLPVDVNRLPEALGLEVIYYPLGRRFDGIYLTHKDIPFIVIDSNLKEIDRRRAIAHECGHRALHHPARKLCLKNICMEQIISEKDECQAELFAAYFLIPEWSELDLEDDNLWDLADRMAVPDDLLKLRLEHEKNKILGYI